jgi:serine protease AprX
MAMEATLVYRHLPHRVRRTRINALRMLTVLLITLVAGIPPLSSVQPAVASAGAPIDPLLQQQMSANPLRPLPVIVEMNSTLAVAGINLQLAQQALSLLQLKGVARVALPLIGSAAGLANAAGISGLSQSPGVAYVHYDREVNAYAESSRLETAYPKAVNADRVWSLNRTGRGVTVAVLDSGIANDGDLTQPTNRILARVNFANELGATTDPGGHGTHVAGTIAGNGSRSSGEYVGIAPEANLVDVRVLDDHGNGRFSSVILGIQWALDHRIQYNIRVLNLSLGAPAPVSYRLDPLAAAAELAWKRGLVVVAAVGNTPGAVHSPGADPYVITVGATDDRGTAAIGDDLLATFSGSGTPAGSTGKPDLVAPGRRIVSIRVPGSSLDQLLADRVETATNGATYFRLSGTSMATAIISGEVALLLQQQPGLTPDNVKAVLTSTSRPFGQTSGTPAPATAIGAGMGDAYAAVTSSPRSPANRGLRPADATARNLYPVVYGQPLTWKNGLLGGVLWNLLSWTNLGWDNLAWDNLAWDNLAWDNLAWDSQSQLD